MMAAAMAAVPAGTFISKRVCRVCDSEAIRRVIGTDWVLTHAVRYFATEDLARPISELVEQLTYECVRESCDCDFTST